MSSQYPTSTSYCVYLDGFSAPTDAMILVPPSFQQLEDALEELKHQLSGPNRKHGLLWSFAKGHSGQSFNA